MATKQAGNLRTFRFVLWSLVIVVALGATALFVFRPFSPPTAVAGEPFYAKPFQMVNQDGVAVSEADFLGKPSAWFFGFTNCPDVCPTTLAELSLLLDSLGPDADKLNVVFVTVDPERDTVEIVKDYVGYFSERIIGLTGTPEAVAQMTKDRFIFFKRVPVDGGYQMEHQASVQLATADGQFFGTLVTEEPMENRLAKLKRLVAGS